MEASPQTIPSLTPAQHLGLLIKYLQGQRHPHVKDALTLAAIKALADGRPVDLQELQKRLEASVRLPGAPTLPPRPPTQE